MIILVERPNHPNDQDDRPGWQKFPPRKQKKKKRGENPTRRENLNRMTVFSPGWRFCIHLLRHPIVILCFRQKHPKVGANLQKAMVDIFPASCIILQSSCLKAFLFLAPGGGDLSQIEPSWHHPVPGRTANKKKSRGRICYFFRLGWQFGQKCHPIGHPCGLGW